MTRACLLTPDRDSPRWWPSPLPTMPREVPGIEDLLKLRPIGRMLQIAPDGRFVAYTVTETDFEQDAFVTQLWLAAHRRARALPAHTRRQIRGRPRWSPDGRWLAFTSARVGDRSQIFAICADGGEATQLTKAETAVNDFVWSPDSRTIAFVASEPTPTRARAARSSSATSRSCAATTPTGRSGRSTSPRRCAAPVAGTQRTRGRDGTSSTPAWSPDGTRLAFSATRTPDLIDGGTADLYMLDARRRHRAPWCRSRGPDVNPRWSPDGRGSRSSPRWAGPITSTPTARIAIVRRAPAARRASLTDSFDEDPSLVDWNAGGCLLRAAEDRRLICSASIRRGGAVARERPGRADRHGFRFTRDGAQTAFVAASPTSMGEVYVASARRLRAAKAHRHDRAARVAHSSARREVVSWNSRDGATIEGVLIKPRDFDASKKYPLLVQYSRRPDRHRSPDAPRSTRNYPSDTWVGARRAGSEGELSRQRRLRREVPSAQRPQPRRRRRVGRGLGRR